jgi:hypothetical protein
LSGWLPHPAQANQWLTLDQLCDVFGGELLSRQRAEEKGPAVSQALVKF